MKTILASFVLLLSSISHADIIKCVFTEPFVTTTYSMTQSKLTYENMDGQTWAVSNVSFQIKAAGLFELVAQDGRVLQTLTLNFNGSNGMSETVYPYSVVDHTSALAANNGNGGCTSNFLHSRDPQK